MKRKDTPQVILKFTDKYLAMPKPIALRRIGEIIRDYPIDSPKAKAWREVQKRVLNS